MLALTLFAAGCEASEPEDTVEATTDRVTYYEHVRPILAEHCVSCHSAGAIAPFTLDSYADAKEFGPLVRAAVESRTMPPWGVNNDGSCQTYTDAKWLAEDEIELIGAWIDGGSEEGDASIPAPTPPVTAALAGDDVVEYELPLYQPAAETEDGLETDDYQCFLIELDLDRERYLTGYDVLPGDLGVAHHAIAMRVDPDFLGNAETMAALDAMSPDQPGWDCFGAAGEGVYPQGVPITWAPGMGAVNFPGDIGIRFSPNDVLVVQMHYNLAEGNAPDQTHVRLSWSDEVEKEGFQVLWDPFLFSTFSDEPASLEPGNEAVTYAWDNSFREMFAFDGIEVESLDLVGIIPHMHKRGTRMSIELVAGGDPQCAGNVDRWDFDWQRTYFYETPLRALADDRMRVECEWDTSGDTEPVPAGFGTSEEMCLLGLFFTAR